MEPAKKKSLIKPILIGCSVLLVAAIAALILWVKLMPGEKIASLFGSESEVAQVLCIYPVKVSGDSMSPTFTNGETVNFNKCFEGENLAVGTIIVFKSDGPMRLGVIREVLEGESGIFYKVSPDAREGDERDVFPDNIVAVYEE